ncbi:hypothetical protein RJ640_026401 [Escallonia rubra]|uniref:Uncharacterized protein n=1 Tax=Escallonia rubra TaxID=112253 RepID=A0AA88U4R8_9ASTE|nr:hypothetical protein RJ640_026401 [Escallonia rubra]
MANGYPEYGDVESCIKIFNSGCTKAAKPIYSYEVQGSIPVFCLSIEVDRCIENLVVLMYRTQIEVLLSLTHPAPRVITIEPWKWELRDTLYVAMILAYGSVRWWKIFSPDQCSGINRFVAIFAVPLLSFHFISTNNPYAMNFRFIIQVVVLVVGCSSSSSSWPSFGPRAAGSFPSSCPTRATD